MLATGAFTVPRSFAQATGPLGLVIVWLIACGGTVMLAFVFQTLAQRRPDLDAGIFAYAKAGFGAYAGFLSALGYWAGVCLLNVTYFVLIKSTLGAIVPAFGHGNTPQAVIAASVLLWAVHLLILRGVKKAAVVNAVDHGLITEAEARETWSLSKEELDAWRKAVSRHGLAALKATAVQRYRDPSGSSGPA